MKKQFQKEEGYLYECFESFETNLEKLINKYICYRLTCTNQPSGVRQLQKDLALGCFRNYLCGLTLPLKSRNMWISGPVSEGVLNEKDKGRLGPIDRDWMVTVYSLIGQ